MNKNPTPDSSGGLESSELPEWTCSRLSISTTDNRPLPESPSAPSPSPRLRGSAHARVPGRGWASPPGLSRSAIAGCEPALHPSGWAPRLIVSVAVFSLAVPCRLVRSIRT